jgi:hypothetical protein
LLPEEEDGVWIEFEAGDPSRPIWTGMWWGDGEFEGIGGDALVRAFVTTAGHKIVIDDDENTIHIEHASGGTIDITDSDMTLECSSGKIVLSDSGVSINDDALTVE